MESVPDIIESLHNRLLKLEASFRLNANNPPLADANLTQLIADFQLRTRQGSVWFLNNGISHTMRRVNMMHPVHGGPENPDNRIENGGRSFVIADGLGPYRNRDANVFWNGSYRVNMRADRNRSTLFITGPPLETTEEVFHYLDTVVYPPYSQ